MKEKLRGALKFFHHEATGGIVLLFAAILAMILANSPMQDLYDKFLHTQVVAKVGGFGVDKSLLHWINDGLMAIFFFLVGLEIKRELMEGELSSFQKAALPAIGAVGGMVVPALIYVGINWGDETALRGWAIPTATDIAFAVGVLALVGSRVPASLKIFLLALAIIDDLGAIIIIAVFYTSKLSVTALGFAAFGAFLLLMLNVLGIKRFGPYGLVGLFVWLCVLKSGVHATLAGVITAFAIPLTPLASKDPERDGKSLLANLEHSLHPWVVFLVLPLFAFANAGVSLIGITMDQLHAPIPLGIAAGLVVGKSIGVFLFARLAIAMGFGNKPAGGWWGLFGVAILAGIGFTMSLFIGMLAFPDPAYAADIRIGVLVGSIISAVVGYLVLMRVFSAPAIEPAKA